MTETQTNDNIIDRDELQEAYVQSILDGMDWKTMEQYVYDSLNEWLHYKNSLEVSNFYFWKYSPTDFIIVMSCS
jgi:hypothetical protein